MKFVNCTPHALTVLGLGTLPACGIVPRCATERRERKGILVQDAPEFRIRLVRQTMGAVEGLPEYEEGTTLIVSGMVLAALNGARSDVVAPDTGSDAIRENGQIVAVRGFVQ